MNTHNAAQTELSAESRRDFLRTTATGGLLLVSSQTAFTYQANSTVELGLLGCGSRGNWIAPFFVEYAGARFVAAADVIRTHLDTTIPKLKVDPQRAYYGGDAYQQIAHSKLDAVVIETPPYFHPEHARAAVDAGKHVFLAKPVAVDVPGCRTIRESAAKANGKLSFLVDFQTRARPAFQEAAERVHRGDIGKVPFAQVYYYAGRPFADQSTPGMDEGQARVMNFYMDRILGGDIIVEQNIHVIDVGNWMLGAHPTQASGTGGRTDWTGTKYNTGDAYDHFAVTYWYPNDVHVSFSSNQLTPAFSDLCVRCFGRDGCADLHYGGLVCIKGKNEWTGAEKDPTFKEGAVSNAKAFVESIRTGKLLNNADQAVESNLTAILGRTAAYRNGTVTWDEMMKSNEKFEAELKLQW